jgi:hypothetical protein
MELYEILKLKNALVNFVSYVIEYNIYCTIIYSFILEIKILILHMAVTMKEVVVMKMMMKMTIIMIKSQARITGMFVFCPRNVIKNVTTYCVYL